MRLSVLSRYGRMGASSRLRMLQFVPALEAAGIVPALRPLFDDRYLEGLYGGGGRFKPVIGAYIRRFNQLRQIRGADAIWLEKEALPWMPAVLESTLLPQGVPIVSDYDDAVFHRYDTHGSAFVRRLLGRKIDRIMAASALVMAGNGYLADRARAAGAHRVEIVPTVVDVERYRVRPTSTPDAAPVIGWIGSPSTWRDYLEPILPMLLDVASRTGAQIKIIGAGVSADIHPLVEVLPWSEESEVEQIQSMDIGIMPLDDSPWARGKCGYKLIQYMACGLPVVASPVGVNTEIIENEENGLLASTESEWREALMLLVGDHVLRRGMGMAGRKKIEEHYSLQIWGGHIAQHFHSVVARRYG